MRSWRCEWSCAGRQRFGDYPLRHALQGQRRFVLDHALVGECRHQHQHDHYGFNERYDVYVAGAGAQCRGHASAFSATARGTPRGKPARPARPTLSAGNGELEVEWTAPANNGAAITDYDVQLQAQQRIKSWSSHSFSGTGTSTTIDDLSNGAAYQVQVRAQNAAGESSWSPSATATPVATGLSMSVSPTPSTDGSYTVSWGVARCFTVWNNQVCQDAAGTGGQQRHLDRGVRGRHERHLVRRSAARRTAPRIITVW